jgi:metal-responsive CopG/Arc/MetJ family transcriptional regulator
MKPIQILMNEETLAELDEDKEVRRRGRSAIFRQLASDYLKRNKEKNISSLYKLAYGDKKIDDEFAGWEKEGIWPEN